jgi:hypothetical protein
MQWVWSGACRQGDRVTNQDQLVVVDGALAVLDGATSWLPQDHARDGGWYARQLSAALTRRLPGVGTPLSALLADAIRELLGEFALDPDRSPYSTATLVRWGDERVEALVLGDSPVLALRRDGDPELLADDRLEPVGEELRQRYRNRLREGTGFDAGHAQVIAQVQAVERTFRNREGGFWVAGADPRAAGQAVTREWPAADLAGVLAMSDGVAAGVREYGLFTWQQLAQDAQEFGPAHVLHRVHQAERQDPHGQRWPRTKRHDDKALAMLRGHDPEAGGPHA